MSDGTLWWVLGNLSPEGKLVKVRVVGGPESQGLLSASWYMGRQADGSMSVCLTNNLSARKSELDQWRAVVCGDFGDAAALIAPNCIPDRLRDQLWRYIKAQG